MNVVVCYINTNIWMTMKMYDIGLDVPISRKSIILQRVRVCSTHWVVLKKYDNINKTGNHE